MMNKGFYIESNLNYLDEIFDIDNKNIVKSNKDLKKLKETKPSLFINQANKQEDKIQQSHDEKIEYVMKDYEYKINKTNAFNLDSLAQEKKIKSLILTKKALLSKLKGRRNEIDLNNKMKIASKIEVTEAKNVKNKKINVFDKLINKRKKIKLETRNRKAKEKALKSKKVKKQLKKKMKVKRFFINYNNFGRINYSKITKHIEIPDWRVFIERQLNDILDNSMLDVDQLSKNLIYQLEHMENDKKEKKILEELHKNSLKLNDFNMFLHDKTATGMKGANEFKKQKAIDNPNEYKMSENDKENQVKNEMKKKNISQIKKELEDLKKQSANMITSKDNFKKTISDLKEFKTRHISSNDNKSNKSDSNMKNNDRNNENTNGNLRNLHKIDEETHDQDESRTVNSKKIENENENENETSKIDKAKLLQIKQRMATFKMKVYDKIDLKKILVFWIENAKLFKMKKKERVIVVKKEDVKVIKEKEEKKIEKSETNVKFEHKKPEMDLLKIIPFCNNIFTIQKSDN